MAVPREMVRACECITASMPLWRMNPVFCCSNIFILKPDYMIKKITYWFLCAWSTICFGRSAQDRRQRLSCHYVPEDDGRCVDVLRTEEEEHAPTARPILIDLSSIGCVLYFPAFPIGKDSIIWLVTMYVCLTRTKQWWSAIVDWTCECGCLWQHPFARDEPAPQQADGRASELHDALYCHNNGTQLKWLIYIHANM